MTISPELTALRDEAMAAFTCEAWAIQKRWQLSRGHDRAGPCPVCGGKDRFSIQTRDNIYNCRKCAISGSGVIKLVMDTEKVEFVTACEIITGRKVSDPVDEQRAAELRRQLDERERQARADADAYRERARREAYETWKGRVRFSDDSAGLLHDYLALRAVDLRAVGADFDKVIGFAPNLPWTEPFESESGSKGWRTLHIGPAMLCCITRPDDHFAGVHITWLDLAQPKGKLILPVDDKGKPRPSKKVRGTKKGGAIRLFTPGVSDGSGQSQPQARRIVMGEGVETTGTPLCHAFERETAYWAGVDLGNMGGKALKIDSRTIHDQPDMDDRECFLPPDWCGELVYLGEGDDAEVRSEEKCARGLKRARRLRSDASSLNIIYVPAGEPGKDMNDLAMMDMRLGDGNVDQSDVPLAGTGVTAD